MNLSLWAPVRALASWCALMTLVSLLTAAASAHVELDAPNGGEAFTVGDVATIQWHPYIEHDTVSWALWYSTVSDNGPWTAIDLDIPPGDITKDAVHTYGWTTPSSSFEEVWVRVKQENLTHPDFFDVSDNSFAILAAPVSGDLNGDGTVDAADYSVFRDSAAPDTAVYAAWVADFDTAATQAANAPAARLVPEPATTVLTLLGMSFMSHRLWRRRPA